MRPNRLLFRFLFVFWGVSVSLIFLNQLTAQSSILRSGPMVGYAEMREVCLWVQTKSEASVRFEYWESDKPNEKKSTETVETFEAMAFSAKIVIGNLEPGKRFNYDLYINNQKLKFDYPLAFQTLPLWQHRNPPPDFKFVIGSCAYINDSAYDRPGTPYGGDYHIFSTMFQNRPDFMLWLGDNTYLREADWGSRSGILHRFSHSRAVKELQPLLASSHHYAIWDDHDYGPNDADRSFRNKNLTLEAFQMFWGNPSYGLEPNPSGITTTFEWGDAQFFLLDNRYFRSNNYRKTGERTILGKQQLEWLLDALKYSKASFKFVVIGGEVLNTAKVYENYINVCPEEREYLLQTIKAERISGVIFLSGDRHITELSVKPDPDFYPIYELTCSPLTSLPAPQAEKEENTLRVPGTFVGVRNFAVLEVVGGKDQRRVIITVKDSTGTILWAVTIFADELKPKK
jgi:alkaline phosphatase D